MRSNSNPIDEEKTISPHDEDISHWVENDNDLLNINCFHYLQYLISQISEDSFLQQKEYTQKVREHCQEFDHNIAYKDLYETFLFSLIKDQEYLSFDSFDPAIHAIFANGNGALKRTAKFMQERGINLLDSSRENIKKVEEALSSEGKTKQNTYTPSYFGSMWGRMSGITLTYHPVYTTSLPSIRTYAHQNDNSPMELRFGTQGLYAGWFGNKPGVNPLFKAWLCNQKNKSPEKSITHIYFNNLGRDREGYEGEWEKGLTGQLELLEGVYPHVAVITFPADKGLMDHHLLKDKTKISKNDAREKILGIATGKGEENIKDFFISQKVKNLLDITDDNVENEILNRLLNEAFDEMGFSDKDEMNQAQLQAVYFHFIKFKLSNFIIHKLQPDSFNMSCKDAIDRGGVASAYYNLIKSIEMDSPMSAEEFAEALHAAPIMVKNRVMNHHEAIIKNALYYYVNSRVNQDKSIPQWLNDWVSSEVEEDLSDDDLFDKFFEAEPIRLKISSILDPKHAEEYKDNELDRVLSDEEERKNSDKVTRALNAYDKVINPEVSEIISSYSLPVSDKSEDEINASLIYFLGNANENDLGCLMISPKGKVRLDLEQWVGNILLKAGYGGEDQQRIISSLEALAEISIQIADQMAYNLEVDELLYDNKSLISAILNVISPLLLTAQENISCTQGAFLSAFIFKFCNDLLPLEIKIIRQAELKLKGLHNPVVDEEKESVPSPSRFNVEVYELIDWNKSFILAVGDCELNEYIEKKCGESEEALQKKKEILSLLKDAFSEANNIFKKEGKVFSRQDIYNCWVEKCSQAGINDPLPCLREERGYFRSNNGTQSFNIVKRLFSDRKNPDFIDRKSTKEISDISDKRVGDVAVNLESHNDLDDTVLQRETERLSEEKVDIYRQEASDLAARLRDQEQRLEELTQENQERAAEISNLEADKERLAAENAEQKRQQEEEIQRLRNAPEAINAVSEVEQADELKHDEDHSPQLSRICGPQDKADQVSQLEVERDKLKDQLQNQQLKDQIPKKTPGWKIALSAAAAVVGLVAVLTGVGAFIGVLILAGMATWAAATITAVGGVTAILGIAYTASASLGNQRAKKEIINDIDDRSDVDLKLSGKDRGLRPAVRRPASRRSSVAHNGLFSPRRGKNDDEPACLKQPLRPRRNSCPH